MIYDIVSVKEYDGPKCKVYTLQRQGSEVTMFGEFIKEMQTKYPQKLMVINNKLETIVKETGAEDIFFNDEYGTMQTQLSALPGPEIRLFCIRIDRTLIIIGDGGIKGKGKSTSDHPKLEVKRKRMFQLAEAFYKKKKSGDINCGVVNPILSGDLKLEI